MRAGVDDTKFPHDSREVRTITATLLQQQSDDLRQCNQTQ